MKWTRRQDIGCKENPGTLDTGNGAMKYIDINRAYPGIQRVTIKSYCGRDSDNEVYYQAIESGDVFSSLAAVKKSMG